MFSGQNQTKITHLKILAVSDRLLEVSYRLWVVYVCLLLKELGFVPPNTTYSLVLILPNTIF